MSRIVCRLGALLDARGMTLVELAAATGITVANLSVLKNDRARAVRFSTLTAICDALACRPADVLDLADDEPAPQVCPAARLRSAPSAQR